MLKVSTATFNFLQLAALIVFVTLAICATVLAVADKAVPDYFGYAATAALGVLFGLPLQPSRTGRERTRGSDE